jgi:hypothetical protein
VTPSVRTIRRSSPGALGVPFYLQEDWNQSPQKLCGPACIKMWQAWRDGSFNSQSQIWQWIETNYPYPISTSGGTSAEAIRAANQYFAGVPTSFDIYGGLDEKRRSLADIIKNLDRREPTIAIVNHGFHAVLVVGASWHDLSTANPSIDFLWIHDPLRSQFMYRRLAPEQRHDVRGRQLHGLDSADGQPQLRSSGIR